MLRSLAVCYLDLISVVHGISEHLALNRKAVKQMKAERFFTHAEVDGLVPSDPLLFSACRDG